MLIPINSSPLSELFYKLYSYDSLSYQIEMLHMLCQSYKSMLEKAENKDSLNMITKRILILKYELIAKFCHYTENFGVFAYACSKSYGLNEINDTFRIVSDYQIDTIKCFYKNLLKHKKINDRERIKLLKIFSYPTNTNTDNTFDSLLEESLKNLKSLIVEIGSCYTDKKLNLIESYNAYKHGYRLLFGKELVNKIDTITFINQGGKEDYVTVNDVDMDEYLKLKNYCNLLFEIMLYNHNTIIEGWKRKENEPKIFEKSKF